MFWDETQVAGGKVKFVLLLHRTTKIFVEVGRKISRKVSILKVLTLRSSSSKQ